VRWRVVAMTPTGYVEGERSLRDPTGAMRFASYPSNLRALAAARDIPAVRRLTWFNHGFEQATVNAGVLTITDLRMGSASDYGFRFDVATRDGDGWRALTPPRQASLLDVSARRLAKALWHRLLRSFAADATGASSVAPPGGRSE
jgi:inner membrane protein